MADGFLKYNWGTPIFGLGAGVSRKKRTCQVLSEDEEEDEDSIWHSLTDTRWPDPAQTSKSGTKNQSDGAQAAFMCAMLWMRANPPAPPGNPSARVPMNARVPRWMAMLVPMTAATRTGSDENMGESFWLWWYCTDNAFVWQAPFYNI